MSAPDTPDELLDPNTSCSRSIREIDACYRHSGTLAAGHDAPSLTSAEKPPSGANPADFMTK
jgi:hypothetical protein